MTKKLVGKYEHFTPHKAKKFLKELEKTGSMRGSAAAVGTTPQTVYNHMNKSPTFKAKVEAAKDLAAHAVELEMRRRAIEGVKEGVWFQGEKVGEETKYSDQLLIKYAQGLLPEKYAGSTSNLPNNQINVIGDSAVNKLASMLNIDVSHLQNNEKVIDHED